MKKDELDALRTNAATGDPVAQYQLGRLLISGSYVDGEFVDQDLAQGLDLLKASATQQHGPAKEYLYDNGARLEQRLKKRSRSDIAPVCFLLGFVALLIFLGFLAGMHYGWGDTFLMGLLTLLSATSCFWMMLLIVFFRSIRDFIQRSPLRSRASDATPASLFLVFAFGFVFVVTLLVIAFRFPDPTVFQYTVFRIVLALAAAGIAAFVPGFLKLQISNWLSAGGALAVFATSTSSRLRRWLLNERLHPQATDTRGSHKLLQATRNSAPTRAIPCA